MQLIEFLAPHFAFVNDPTAWAALITLAVTLILDLFCLWAEGKLNGEERGKGGPEEPEIRREA